MIWRIRLACWISNATCTYAHAHAHASGHPRERTHACTHRPISNTYCFSTATMIRELASIWRYTYIACLAAVYFQSPMFILLLPALSFKNSTFFHKFICFVCISEERAIISLYITIKPLVFMTETVCVYCAVQPEFLNKTQITFVLQRTMARIVAATICELMGWLRTNKLARVWKTLSCCL